MNAVTAVLALCAAPAVQEVAAYRPADAVLMVHADAAKLRALDAARKTAYEMQGEKLGIFKPKLPYVRYFWYPYDKAKVENRLIAFKLLFNKLSTEPEFVTPALIASNVLRVDTRALGWGERQLAVLERFAENGIDVFFHQKKTWNDDKPGSYDWYWPGGVSDTDKKYYGRKRYEITLKKGESYFAPSPLLPQDEIDDLRGWLYSEVPLLNAEQFFLYTSRQQSIHNKEQGVGYYEWFGKNGLRTRDDYFDAVGLDIARAQKQLKEWRSFLQSRTSKVAQNSRFVVAYNGVNGRVWGTEDIFTEDAKNLAALRLRRGEAAHDAEEWFGPLANGLPVTFLNAANRDKAKDGKAQAKAPPEVGGDKSELNIGNDPAIHDDISCMRCHAKDDMLMPFKKRDWVRNFFAPGKGRKLTDPDEDVERELQRQYMSDIHKLMAKDQADYAEAVAECTKSARHPKGLTCTVAFDIYCKLWNELAEADPKTELAPITRAVLCRNIGCSEKAFLSALKKYVKFRGQSNTIAVRFLDDDGAMSWEELEATYAFFAGLMYGQAIPEKVEREKKQ